MLRLVSHSDFSSAASRDLTQPFYRGKLLKTVMGETELCPVLRNGFFGEAA
jgi:hypothetical protein